MTTSPSRAWQRMLSGRKLDLLNPDPQDIEAIDIAHGLARIARWNGQTQGKHVFSVAQHSLLVEAIGLYANPHLTPSDRLVLLLHDSPEYVIGDIISPFKAVVGEAYKDVEKRLLKAIHRRFSLPEEPSFELKTLIKQADRQAAFCEATTLAGFDQQEAESFFEPFYPMKDGTRHLLEPWPTEIVQLRYLQRLKECIKI